MESYYRDMRVIAAVRRPLLGRLPCEVASDVDSINTTVISSEQIAEHARTHTHTRSFSLAEMVRVCLCAWERERDRAYVDATMAQTNREGVIGLIRLDPAATKLHAANTAAASVLKVCCCCFVFFPSYWSLWGTQQAICSTDETCDRCSVMICACVLLTGLTVSS